MLSRDRSNKSPNSVQGHYCFINADFVMFSKVIT